MNQPSYCVTTTATTQTSNLWLQFLSRLSPNCYLYFFISMNMYLYFCICQIIIYIFYLYKCIFVFLYLNICISVPQRPPACDCNFSQLSSHYYFFINIFWYFCIQIFVFQSHKDLHLLTAISFSIVVISKSNLTKYQIHK